MIVVHGLVIVAIYKEMSFSCLDYMYIIIIIIVIFNNGSQRYSYCLKFFNPDKRSKFVVDKLRR